MSGGKIEQGGESLSLAPKVNVCTLYVSGLSGFILSFL
jgi:hypothetical protein